ncbi:MAG: hypothetical protein SFY92_00540 [Verrucomicrobiae bacterium]|nr:hypothetical protein [Verrucomicrobiae bacterium]
MSYWPSPVRWDTPSGYILQKLFDVLPSEYSNIPIRIFGSSALQLTVTEDLNSADTDICIETSFNPGTPPLQTKNLFELVRNNKLDSCDPYIQVCQPQVFEPGPNWGFRVLKGELYGKPYIIPHPIDILVSKVNRADIKDVSAFHKVIAAVGHPTEQEMIVELQTCLPLYLRDPKSYSHCDTRPKKFGNYKVNTEKIWEAVWGRKINVQKEIIEPAIQVRYEGYSVQMPQIKSDVLARFKQASRFRH